MNNSFDSYTYLYTFTFGKVKLLYRTTYTILRTIDHNFPTNYRAKRSP